MLEPEELREIARRIGVAQIEKGTNNALTVAIVLAEYANDLEAGKERTFGES